MVLKGLKQQNTHTNDEFLALRLIDEDEQQLPQTNQRLLKNGGTGSISPILPNFLQKIDDKRIEIVDKQEQREKTYVFDKVYSAKDDSFHVTEDFGKYMKQSFAEVGINEDFIV
ncbi:unnamed protein product [Didymodactylos carnosus]|uniref:Uncharacterized protein n=1 Tax=Didymodactylos carnosus TaxID=1234261 RepID=A0A814E817_9BILA|nr:unnamed protein product [Didymodactylos carnosus]CAF1193502.1 unnamed protein product [Didymodactylos carnosus]CAF3739152.1 unnamed protein product [Didymodactylos carnosus]CAF4003788.1 unnamed protein product [Didymodactylos carnosus]